MNIATVGFLGRLVLTVCLFLAFTTYLPSCSQEIPILVSIHGVGIESSNLTLTPTLAEVPQSAIKLANPNAQIVLYLPASASGRLRLAVHGEDPEGCTLDGSTEVDVVPVRNSALEAVIEIDPKLYPTCKLTVAVSGRGSVSSLNSGFYCPGQDSSNPCVEQVHKGTNLTLIGNEDSVDIGQDGWQGNCSVATERCDLVVDREMKVQTSFSKRVCSSNGSCTADGTNSDNSGRRVSSNGLWAVGSRNTLFAWDGLNSKWNFVYQLKAQAQVLWASAKFSWMVSDNIIWKCTLSGCVRQQGIDTPRTIYAFGGDDTATPSFWVANKSTIYRCSAADSSCKQTAVKDLMLGVDHISPRILNITADTGNEAILSGYYPDPKVSCIAFVRHCTGQMCDESITKPLLSCSDASAFRFREQIGSPLTLWVYLKDLPELIRFPTRSNLHPSSGRRIPIRASIGISGTTTSWAVGDGGKIISCNSISCQDSSPITDNLNAVWVDQAGVSWIAGDHGSVISCSSIGPTCSPHVTPSKTPNFDVIRGDALGNVWALSQNGDHISCDKNPNLPCMKVASVP